MQIGSLHQIIPLQMVSHFQESPLVYLNRGWDQELKGPECRLALNSNELSRGVLAKVT